MSYVSDEQLHLCTICGDNDRCCRCAIYNYLQGLLECQRRAAFSLNLMFDMSSPNEKQIFPDHSDKKYESLDVHDWMGVLY